MTIEPVTVSAVWISGHYFKVKDSSGAVYALPIGDWKFPYLGSCVRVYLQSHAPVAIESKPLWEDCRELVGITPVASLVASHGVGHD